ncbi:hypothetical protein [Chryseobacterium oryctis]|uniref:Uncharacterized protein n=1 Tax=Chryseobacterium oryctis TaxID=2952618 RepID=A0ABT3HR33_9FLAO|nr:hypothetical protein [Chryseobacterium oryctis]MCW3162251.1 hypothetical protein [Chryseobacterium oryctis]
MKYKFFLITLFLMCFSNFSAQEIHKYLYKGTIDKLPVTLFLIEEISGCPTTHYSGMYKYDKVSNWLYLEISDNEDDKLVMVEGGITGIISVKKTGDNLKGFWISPDGNKKLNVNLQKVKTNAKTIQPYDEKYEQVNYEMNDC